MSSYVKMKVTDEHPDGYNATDLALLGRLLDDMADSPVFGLDQMTARMLQSRFKALSKDVGEALYPKDKEDGDEEQDEDEIEPPAPFLAEAWHAAYLQSSRFDLWAASIPEDMLARLAGKRDVVQLACLNLRQFRDLDSGYALDILAPSVLKQKAVADPMVSMLLDPAFPAYTDERLLRDGRLIVIPTMDAVRRMSSLDAFKSGEMGVCRLTKGDPRQAEHVRGVRVTLDAVQAVLEGRQNVYDMMYPDLEPDDDPLADVSEDELEALSRRLPDLTMFSEAPDIGEGLSY